MALPEILNIGFKVDEPKLWKEKVPVEIVPISELEHNLDIPYLESLETDDWNLSPRMLLQNFEIEKFHAKKVEDADLQYPIEIYNHMGKWIILDGVHRFTKAVKLGKENIKVRKIPAEIARRCLRDKQPE